MNIGEVEKKQPQNHRMQDCYVRNVKSLQLTDRRENNNNNFISLCKQAGGIFLPPPPLNSVFILAQYLRMLSCQAERCQSLSGHGTLLCCDGCPRSIWHINAPKTDTDSQRKLSMLFSNGRSLYNYRGLFKHKKGQMTSPRQ